MEVYNKRRMMIFSIAQIVLSAIFFTIGMVDGFQIRFEYVSVMFMPCWIAALALAIGVMELVLAQRHTPSSFLKNAIWSVSVACIICSEMTVYRYISGIQSIVMWEYFKESNGPVLGSHFMRKDIKLEYTDKEKTALAVFALIITFLIIQIILAAFILKSNDASYQTPQTPQPSTMFIMQPYQDGQQLGYTNTRVSQIQGNTADNVPIVIHQ